MTRIDFYLDAEDRLQVACRIAAKAHAQSLRTAIYAPDGETAKAIDRMLWMAPSTGFFPHVMADHKLAPETPIVIAREAPASDHHDDVLINLGPEQPATFARYRRLVEIVGRDEADKQAARSRYKFYRDRGYEIHTHKLGEGGAGG